MKQIASADIVIFGGGIAGLWLLTRLRQSGLTAILFECGHLGGGQTHKAQGIIHGGLKYALQGILGKESNALIEVPEEWKKCLSGEGKLNLTSVPILSQYHYLWTPNKLTGKLTGLLASSLLSSQVISLAPSDYPSIFQHKHFKGEVYALEELVLDIPALVRELVKMNQDAIFQIEPVCGEELKLDEKGQMTSATVYLAGQALEVKAQQFIFTAGSGNQIIINKLSNFSKINMQRRPLHMVLLKPSFHHVLYGHCIGLGRAPRVTVTTHYLQEGDIVWYLGGQLAEEGVKYDSHLQIKATIVELSHLFPWLNFKNGEFSTFLVDRAEPTQAYGLKPETCYSKHIQNITVAWPVKLALAPKLTTSILHHFEKNGILPKFNDLRALRAWPIPPLACPIWEDAFCKKIA